MKIDLTETGWESVKWVHLAENRDQSQTCQIIFKPANRTSDGSSLCNKAMTKNLDQNNWSLE